MRGLWLENREARFRHDLPKPVAGEGEALVRVRLAGVCGTDLELLNGYASFEGVPGHEFVGEIVGGPDPSRIGQRVVGRINVVCRECPACRAGRDNHCERRTVLGIRGRDGAFAEFLVLPLENLLPVPAGVADEAAVFTEPLAAAFRILEQISITPSHRVVVVGAGRLGQLVARVLALSGCELRVVVRRDTARRALAGVAAEAVDESEVTDGWADAVVEVSGSPEGFRLARRAVRPEGAILLKSAYPGAVKIDLPALAVDEIRLIGSRCGPFQPALRALQSGLVDPRPLIHDRFPLEGAAAALEKAARPGVLKVLIDPLAAV